MPKGGPSWERDINTPTSSSPSSLDQGASSPGAASKTCSQHTLENLGVKVPCAERPRDSEAQFRRGGPSEVGFQPSVRLEFGPSARLASARPLHGGELSQQAPADFGFLCSPHGDPLHPVNRRPPSNFPGEGDASGCNWSWPGGPGPSRELARPC